MTGSRQGDIFQPGTLLNNTYRIEAILGRGGTSEVYRARSEVSGRTVALKVLRVEFSRNEDYLNLMTREENIREIRHDAIVRYFDTQRTGDGTVYLVMDFVDGPGLDERLREGGLPAADLLMVAGRVADGLVAAHGRNIVHRDLSPDNIILRGGNPADAVIIDFGIAKDSNPGAETIVGNEFAGKYGYAAPEQLSGQTDARSDLYALGALLLATFRGRQPDLGRTPLEVLQRKMQPLDTEGVPEPLKSLIDRMAHPAPNQRFQSARALLEASRESDAPPPDDVTRIVPRRRTRPLAPETVRGYAPASAVQTVPAFSSPVIRFKPDTVALSNAGAGSARHAQSGQKRPGRRVAAAAVLLAAIAGGGLALGMFGDVFGQRFPAADPFALVIERQANGAATATGFVPSEEARGGLSERIAAQGGRADVVLASGVIAPSWGNDMLDLLDTVSVLPEWRIVFSDNNVRVTGVSLDRAERDRVLAALNGPAMSAAFSGTVQIDLGPRILTEATLIPLLAQFDDCGALTLVDPPAVGYPIGATITVEGWFADAQSRVGLSDAISGIAGDRNVQVRGEALNQTLCLVDQALPAVPSGGFSIRFGYGDRAETNSTGRYFVGENPVIDITIPAEVTDGYLFASVVDVSGSVLHMLPNAMLPTNAVADLRAGSTGLVTRRVVFPPAESAGGSKLSFVIDGTTLGKSRVLVIHADSQIFDGLRPLQESAQSYAAALAERSGPIRTLDSRILTSAQR